MGRWAITMPVAFWLLITLLIFVIASGTCFAFDLLSWLGWGVKGEVLGSWSFSYNNDPYFYVREQMQLPTVPLYCIAGTTVTKHRRLSDWTMDSYFLTFLKDRNLRSKGQQVCFLLRPLSLGLQMATFSLCPTQLFFCVCIYLCSNLFFF